MSMLNGMFQLQASFPVPLLHAPDALHHNETVHPYNYAVKEASNTVAGYN